jgi:hypothetical protein
MSSASFSCLIRVRLHALCCIFFVWDFLAGFSCFLWAVVRFPNEISNAFYLHIFRARFPCGGVHAFAQHNLLMRFHAFWVVTRFAHESSCFLALMRFPEISV